MILNERQYGITKTKIKEFEQAQAKLINSPVLENRNEQLRHQAYLDTINNQLEVLRREIKGATRLVQKY